MSNFQRALTDELIQFVERQPIFFVATATSGSRVSLSPKGLDSIRILDDSTVAYLDLTGSGNETAAHIKHDGRLTIMFCSFDAKPLILRLYGRGEVVRPSDERWDELLGRFNPLPGQRQIIVLHIESLQTSCGFAVPRMDLVEPRTKLTDWALNKSEEELAEYRRKKNARSIDGLPVAVEVEK